MSSKTITRYQTMSEYLNNQTEDQWKKTMQKIKVLEQDEPCDEHFVPVGEDTRVFFVVDSIEDNEEIFTTLQEAREWWKKINPKDKPRIYVALVENAYYDHELKGWNYEDFSNTFEIIHFIKE